MKQRDFLLFTGLFILILLLHWPAREAGFVTDFTGLWSKMQGKSILDALGSFGFPSLMPLLNVFYFLLFKCFGLNGAIWLCFFVAIYTIGLVFFYKSIPLLIDRADSKYIAAGALALIIFCPYQVEALIWKVGLGHIAGVSFFLAAYYFGLAQLRNKSTSSLTAMVLWLIASLFCFEWGLVFPAIILLSGLYLRSQSVWKTILVSSLVVFMYLVLTKFFIGNVVGHYEINAAQLLDIPALVGTSYKYFVKHLGLVHFCPFEIKSAVYNFGNSSWAISLVGILVVISSYVLIRSRNEKNRLLSAVYLMAMASLVLVLPLFFSYTLLSENDRYGSLFVPFFALLVMLTLMRLNKKVAITLFVGFLVVNIFYQQKLIKQWTQSHSIVSSLIDSFPDKAKEPILMLNLPENLNGTFMFRDFVGDNPMKDHLRMYGVEIQQMDLVAQYNVPKGGQKALASWVEKGNVLELKNEEWGSWWWRNGIGASSYETDKYKVELGSRLMKLTLLDTSYYKQIIYTDGKEWIDIK